MKPATVAWLANLRAQAAEPEIIYVAVQGPHGSFPVFPEDVTNKSDEQLLAFLRERLSATPTRGAHADTEPISEISRVHEGAR